MIETQVVILNEIGLHARTAKLLAQNAMLFKSQIMIEGNNKLVNGKSMLSIMSLGIKQGNTIKIIAEGNDEESAIEVLINLIENNFNS